MTAVATYPVAHIDITLDDINVLNYVKTLLSQMKGVQKVAVSPMSNAQMTEQEFYQKIDRSLESAKMGAVYRMDKGESMDQFIDRLLCIK